MRGKVSNENESMDRRRALGRFAAAGAGAAAGVVGAGALVPANASTPLRALVPRRGQAVPDDLGDLIIKGPHPWVDVRAYGATGDGTGDDSSGIVAALQAASTGKGGTVPVYLPAGVYRITTPLAIPSNVTFFGDGSRPGNQGGTEIRYAGAGTAVVAGAPGTDWSNSQIRSLRIVAEGAGSGWGLQVFNPTNVSTVTDVLISGFSEGQLHISNGSGGGSNPGANFFRLSNFFLIGGRTPLYIQRGRQTVFVEFGGIDVGDTSERGMLIESGEAQAHTTTVEAVKVESRGRDVPGFVVSGIAPVLFVGCTFYNMPKTGTQPAFLYTNAAQPDLQTELLSCTTMGTSVLVSAPERGVTIPADPKRGNYIPHLTVAGAGSMVVPMTTRTEKDRTWAMHKDVIMGWTGDDGNRANIDTTFYRRGAGNIETPGRLVALDGMTTKTVKGPVSDSSFKTTPADGTVALDTTNHRLYVRSNGSWKKVQLG